MKSSFVQIIMAPHSELISLYDNVLFVFECFHDQQDSQWHEKASRKHPTKQQQNGQIVFLLSSDSLAQCCVNLSRWFTHKTAFFTEQCTTHRFFTTSKSLKVLVATHLITTASNLGWYFLYLYYRCALKDHLATTRNC